MTIFFLHIPRTAGTSLRMAALRNYPKEKVLLLYPTGDGRDVQLPPPEERSRFEAIFGHYPFGLHKSFGGKANYVSFVRDPVDLIVSHYNFLMNSDMPLHRKWRGNGTIEEMLENDWTFNLQTQYLSGLNRLEVLKNPERAFSLASKNMDEHFLVVGLTERFEESITLIGRRLGWTEIDYGYWNTSSSRDVFIRKSQLDESIINRIRERSTWDEKLHDLVRERLDDELKSSRGRQAPGMVGRRIPCVRERKPDSSWNKVFRRGKGLLNDWLQAFNPPKKKVSSFFSEHCRPRGTAILLRNRFVRIENPGAEPGILIDSSPDQRCLHLAVRGGEASRILRMIPDDPAAAGYTVDLSTIGGRQDLFIPVPPGAGQVFFSGTDPVELEDLHLDRQDHFVKTNASFSSIADSNWRQVKRQEAERRAFCPAYPEYLLLELTTACNFRCRHCPTHGPDAVHGKNNRIRPMTPYLLDKLADEIFPFLRRANLVGRGEPFCTPQPLLTRFIEHLERTSTLFEASTNGVLLDDELIDRLLPILGQITFSVDAATEETYFRIRRNREFRRIIRNIRRLREKRDSVPLSRRFPISLNFTLTRSNVHELPSFIRMSADLGVDFVYVRHVVVYFPELRDESLVEDPELVNPAVIEAAGLSDELGLAVFLPDLVGNRSEDPSSTPTGAASAGKAKDAPPPPRKSACSFLWRTLSVMCNGDVYACGRPGAPIPGNLNDRSVASIWNDPVLREMRSRLDGPDPHPSCASCWFREMAYFDSPANEDDFLSTRGRKPREHDYDAKAFVVTHDI